MDDLADIHVEWLEYFTRRTRDSAPLIAHIHDGGNITDGLREVIISILDGTLKAKPKVLNKLSAMDSNIARASLSIETQYWKKKLDKPPHDLIDEIDIILRSVGILRFPEEGPARTDAARKIVAHLHGLTVSQLDAARYLRPSRPRKR